MRYSSAQPAVLMSGYYRTLLSCSLISFTVGLTHTILVQTWLGIYYQLEEGLVPSLSILLAQLYAPLINNQGTDDFYNIIAIAVIIVIPYRLAYTFTAEYNPQPLDTDIDTVTVSHNQSGLSRVWKRLRRALTIRHSNTALVLFLLCTVPVWEWVFVYPAWALWTWFATDSEVPQWIRTWTVGVAWRWQELWIFVVVPVILTPIIYTSRCVQPQFDIDQHQVNELPLSIAASLQDNQPLLRQSTTPSSKMSFLIKIIPARWRGLPPSTLYLVVLLLAITWWLTYVPDMIFMSVPTENWDDLRYYAQRSKVIVLLIATTAIATTTVRQRYRSHIAYVTLVSFLYAAFPFSLGIAIDYCYAIYIDKSVQWYNRAPLIGCFYLVSTIMNYLMRMLSRSAVPSASAVALIFGWTLFEDTAGDLAFTEIGPSSSVFWIAVIFLVLKTIVRDLDIASDVLSYLQRHYWTIIQPNVDGSAPLSEIEAELRTRMHEWRIRYDRLLLRHQNFLAENSSKIIVITGMALDTALSGEYLIWNSAVPWLTVYTPCRSVVERYELLSGLVVLWIIQAIVHFSIVAYLDRRQKQEAAAAQQQVLEKQYCYAEHDGPAVIELDDLSPTSVVPTFGTEYWLSVLSNRLLTSHWPKYQLLYLTCIPSFFYISLSAIVNANNFNCTCHPPWNNGKGGSY